MVLSILLSAKVRCGRKCQRSKVQEVWRLAADPASRYSLAPSQPEGHLAIFEVVGDAAPDVESDVAVEAQFEVCGSSAVQPYGDVM
jgi:hypothetical protein